MLDAKILFPIYVSVSEDVVKIIINTHNFISAIEIL